MTRVRLTGPLWSQELLQEVLGSAVPAEHGPGLTLDGELAARVFYFAQVVGFEVHNTGPSEVEVTATHKVEAAVLTRAAREVMGYYGRLNAAELRPRRQMILARAAVQIDAAQDPAPTALRSDMRRSAVEVSDDTATHEGFFLTRTYQLRHPWFDGGTSDVLIREVFEATDAALILPYDPERDRVLLVEQFRLGPFGRGDPYPWVLEPVAGRIDAGETPQEAAHRECLEETGVTLSKLEHISSHYCTPGCSTEYFHCFLGLTDLPDTTKRVGGLETENEDIRRHVIPFGQAMDLMRSGEINIGPLYLMLLWLERERPRLCSPA